MGTVVGSDGADIEGHYLRMVITPAEGAVVQELHLLATDHDVAGTNGLLQEGFGVGSFYVPNRRLNERLEIVDTIRERPVLRYTYDCDGPNIKGLRVERTMELLPDEASLRVTWRVENRGDEEQWVAPWVRNDVSPGGRFSERLRVDVPTIDGIKQARSRGYHLASRNWAAVTDPEMRQTVYGVFDVEHVHSFLAIYDADARVAGFQTAFVPFALAPGDEWETVYRINVARGLSKVDFATDELAAELSRSGGELELLLAGVRETPSLTITPRILSADDRLWRLPGRRFALDPNALVRARFEWAAPGDGVYDFLAQIERDGDPLELGRDTSSPHGGIDTQFAVGEVDWLMEPWSDGPFALRRGGRTLERTLARRLNDPDDVAIWFDSSLVKIFREDRVAPRSGIQTTAQVQLARNERESFQLVVRPPSGRRLRNLNVRVNALRHEGGRGTIPADDISVKRVGYYPVRIPTHFENPTGDWPDPLPPFEPFTVEGGECAPLWFTVYARPGLPAGTYTGMIELTSPDLDPVELFIEAEVFDFDLPTTPALKTDFGYWSENAYDWSRRFGYSGSREALDEAYRNHAAERRVTLRQTAQLPAESPDYESALNAFARRLDDLKAQGITTFAMPSSLLDVPEQLRMANAFVRDQGLSDRAFTALADMPAQPAWSRLFERLQEWKSIAPDIPVMVTTFGLSPFLPEALDIWAVHLPVLDTINNRPILERVQEGGEVWWFVNHEPGRPYGNFFIEFAPMEHRILFWQTWALGIKGFHYSGINLNEANQNPYINQLDITPANGNGFLVYPGPDGPVSSIRWETIRDGIEDFDYLVLFQQRLRRLQRSGDHPELVERAERVYDFSELVPDLVTFTRDGQVLNAKREEIARSIVEMNRALGE